MTDTGPLRSCFADSSASDPPYRPTDPVRARPVRCRPGGVESSGPRVTHGRHAERRLRQEAYRSVCAGSGFRFYNPSTGRWPSRDPIEEPGFLLLNASAALLLDPAEHGRRISKGSSQADHASNYAFVANEPTTKTDYLGLSEDNSYTVKKCRIDILIIHNTVINNVKNSPCSAAATISCAASTSVDVEAPLPGWTAPSEGVKLYKTPDWVDKAMPLAQKHAYRLCKCGCKKVTVKVVCHKLGLSRAGMPGGVCGRKWTLNCCPKTPWYWRIFL